MTSAKSSASVTDSASVSSLVKGSVSRVSALWRVWPGALQRRKLEIQEVVWLLQEAVIKHSHQGRFQQKVIVWFTEKSRSWQGGLAAGAGS